MADVYKIQAVINLGGNIAPELNKILKAMDQTEKEAKGVEKAVGRWTSPIDRATASVGKFARAMADARKNAHSVDREIAKMRSGLSGLKAPAGGMDREIARWATAMGRPLAEMRSMRRETQGVGSAVRGVSRTVDSWAGRIGKATAAMRQFQRAAANVHLPPMPHGVGGGAVGGGRRYGGSGGRGGSSSSSGHRRRAHSSHQFGQHEGSYLAGAIGVQGGIETLEYAFAQGGAARREDLRAKNAGLTPEEVVSLRERANVLSRQYPSLSPLDIREQGRLLIPNVGSYDAAMEVLPEYLKGQVALQTTAGPDQGKKDMEYIARAIDIWGHSMSIPDSRAIIDGFIKSRGVDNEAIKGNDYVNAAQAMAAPGKSLSVDFKSKVLPAMISQQGGARTGTDIASAYQNTVVGRGTNESLLAQYDEGFRVGLKWHWNKSKTKRIIDHKGGMIDSPLLNLNPYEWDKKHTIPKMVSKGMLPSGYAQGDYSEELTPQQRSDSNEYLSKLYSARRGANIHSIFIEDVKQIEEFLKRLSKAVGTSDILKDMRSDPGVSTHAVKMQTGAFTAAFAGSSIENIVAQTNKIADALGSAADTLAKHPVATGTAFGAITAGVGGAAAAGGTALIGAGLAAIAASPIAIAVGTGAVVTIAAVTIPWDAIKQSIFGIEPATKGVGRDAHLERMRRTAALNKVVGPRDFTLGLPGATPSGAKMMPDLPAPKEMSWWEIYRNYGRGGLKRPPQAPSMFNTVPGLPDGPAWKSATETGGAGAGGAPAAIQQASQATGQLGSNSATAAPNIAKAAEAAASAATGYNASADGANKAAGAANSAGGALAGLAARLSVMSSFGIPGAKAVGTPPAVGAGGAGGGAGSAAPAATPGKSSSVYRGGDKTITVATNLNLDGRAVGRAVTRHQVASLDTRAGTARFVGSGAKTPVGQPMPVIG